MKSKQILGVLTGFVMMLIAGCYMINPKFNKCSDICTKSQVDCMTNAINASEIRICKTEHIECFRACEMQYPKYIERK
jgi:hypothetical protein